MHMHMHLHPCKVQSLDLVSGVWLVFRSTQRAVELAFGSECAVYGCGQAEVS